MVRVLLLRGPGTNCDMETEFAFKLAGADVTPMHIWKLKENPGKIFNYQILVIPGGFTYGDYLGGGTVFSFEIKKFMLNEVREFVERGNLVLGICNGFQILVKAGIIPGWEVREITLGFNKNGRFIDRWVKLQVKTEKSPFLYGIDRIELPIAHAEGRVSLKGAHTMERLLEEDDIALIYLDNPNGSQGDIAGLVDTTGNVLGLMPHPERNIFPHHGSGDGIKIFENAVRYFK